MLSTIRKIKSQKWYRYVWFVLVAIWLGSYAFNFFMRSQLEESRELLNQQPHKSFMEEYEESLKKNASPVSNN